ncbi:MAG: hypothetical protein GEU90_15960 [Gemmatimonas sp.]|nr:hypothetical protein [Gemmatimonas sp.]
MARADSTGRQVSRIICVALGIALFWPSEVSGQTQASRSNLRIEALRVDGGPRIDGLLDDDVWLSAPLLSEFTQQEPDEGAPASERTEIRILHDGNSLYLGVHAYDSAPDEVIATELRRDGDRILEEDNIQLILDTFMDSRSAYMFVVSPVGAQLDQQVFDEGGRDRRGSGSAINRDWDGVWSVVAARVADGWVAEIEIPLVTLRFPEGEPQSWGINVMRNIGRKNEQAYWAPIPKPFGLTRVSLAGSLTDLESLSRGRDLRVKPYVTGGARGQRDGTIADNSAQGDVGLDVKYGITAGLNLDVTINTDFAQAEVDDEQVNLTRFALFYPEKREFFLENAGMFTVGTTNSTGRIADLFFSRQIGISATRQEVPILGGARLTGKVGANNLAVMDLQTGGVGDDPGENFLVARYSRDILDRSQVGGLVINKQASEGGHFNRTYAGDMLLSLTPSLTVEGFVAGTSSPDPSEDNLAGHLRAGWLDQSWRIYTEYTDLGANFNPEVGFVPRVGIRRSKVHFEGNPRPGRWGIRVMEPMWNATYITDQTGRLVSRQFHHMVATNFENGAVINIMHNRYFERLDSPFEVSSGVSVPAGDYTFWDLILSFRSNPSRRIFYNVSYSPQTFWDGDRTDWTVQLGARVTDKLATSAGLSRNDVELPAGSFVADVGSLQLDYGFSPKASVRTLTQYNSLTEQWSNSARFRYIHRPGSDLYVVYDEVRRGPDDTVSPFLEEVRDRRLIVKLTYLMSM